MNARQGKAWTNITCPHCGDVVARVLGSNSTHPVRQCDDCAAELGDGTIPPPTHLGHDCGGGRRVIRSTRHLA